MTGRDKDSARVGRCDISKWQRPDDDTPQLFCYAGTGIYESPVFAEAVPSDGRSGGEGAGINNSGCIAGRCFLVSWGLERGVPQSQIGFV